MLAGLPGRSALRVVTRLSRRSALRVLARLSRGSAVRMGGVFGGLFFYGLRLLALRFDDRGVFDVNRAGRAACRERAADAESDDGEDQVRGVSHGAENTKQRALLGRGLPFEEPFAW